MIKAEIHCHFDKQHQGSCQAAIFDYFVTGDECPVRWTCTKNTSCEAYPIFKQKEGDPLHLACNLASGATDKICCDPDGEWEGYLEGKDRRSSHKVRPANNAKCFLELQCFYGKISVK